MSHIEDGRLHAYLDGECVEREIEQIEAHVAICDACQDRLAAAMAATRMASGLLADVEPGPVSAPGWRELEERAATRTRAGPRRVWARPSLAWAAVIAIAFGLGWFSNNYWSSASYAPDSGLRKIDAPIAAADALEPGRSPRATTVAPAAIEHDQPPVQSKEIEARILQDSRLKTAYELPATPTPTGRQAAAEGEQEAEEAEKVDQQ